MTTTQPAQPTESLPLRDPAGRGGLVDVFRRRYLLKLLVRKEVKVRYQGSVLGMGWSYVQPAMRFVVYFVVIGLILGMDRRVPNFPVHIFCGVVMVHFFGETLGSTTRSVFQNKALVRKVGLPREMFPVSSLLVSAVNIIPGLVILVIASLATGWEPTWHLVPSLLLALSIMAVWGFGVGLLFSAFNVYYRDFTKVVQVITTLLPWSTPMIYAYEMVRDQLGQGSWALQVYLANPVAEAVMLTQQALWVTTIDPSTLTPAQRDQLDLVPHIYERGLIMLVVGLLVVLFSQAIFKRLESSFAEQL